MAFLKKQAAGGAEPFRVPDLTEVSSEYAALIARKHDLDTQRGAVESELRGLAKGRLSATLVEKTTAARRARAAELLGDLAPTDGDIPLRPSRSDVEARDKELRAEAGAIDAALAVVSAKLGPAKSEAERAVCHATRDSYRGAYKDLACALAAAQRAHREAVRIRDDLYAQGIDYGAHLPMPSAVGLLGNPFERHVKLDHWLREAVAAGLLKPEEIDHV